MGVKILRIYQLDSIVNARRDLVGGFFEVEVPLGPVAGGYQNKRVTVEQLAEAVAASPTRPTAQEVFDLLEAGDGIGLTLNPDSGKILITNKVQATPVIQRPTAPTAGVVDDIGDTFSFLPTAAYPSFSQYKVSGLPGVTGAVALDATNSYVQGSRIYVKVVGAVAKGGLAVYVAGSGNVPDGAVLTNAEVFTGSAVVTPPATKATAPYFGTIDDVNNVVSLGSAYSFTEVRWGVEGQGPQALGSNSICSPGNIVGRLFAYVVADSASNRLQSDTVYSGTFTLAATAPANNAPTVTLSSPQAGQSLTVGDPVVLNASPEDADGASDIKRVEFLDNGVKFTETTVAPHTVQRNITAGGHSFTARVFDTAGAYGLSNAVQATGVAATGGGTNGKGYQATYTENAPYDA